PSLDIVDVDGLQEAAGRAFAEDAAATVGYGTAVGFVPLREWIAERHGVPVEQVLVTNGSMQADAFLFALMVQAGDAVLVEAPTYDRTLLNLRQRGADLRPISLETDGIDVDAVESILVDGVRPKLAHIIPNFQNPAGYTLSADKRTRLLQLAAEYDVTIFEDDPYVSIRFEGESLPTMLESDDAGKVVYASSFSKTVCPGIRVGYLVGPQAIIGQVQSLATNTYISPNMVAQSIVNQFCRSGRLDSSVQTVRTALRERRDALVTALRRDLPQARFEPPQGGYFMWVELPEDIDVATLETAASERGVVFVKGSDFLLDGGANTMRLAYSGVTPDEIDEGVRRLADAVASVSA
ncbi:MAG: Transcriptional regulator, GntR family domain / Aspartate aminotransferase, partial [uncultured Solirubrobacteraceae bacterium]